MVLHESVVATCGQDLQHDLWTVYQHVKLILSLRLEAADASY